MWTYQRLLRLPESTLPCEIWGGERISYSSPHARHQRIARDLGYLLHIHVRSNRLGEILFAPTDVVFDEHWVTQPDILLVRRERRHIIAGSRQHDRVEKFEVYARFEVPEYWLVDPDDESIEVYTLERDSYQLAGRHTGDDTAPSQVIRDFAALLDDVFFEE